MVRNAQGLVNAWPEREFQSWGNEHGFSSDLRDNLDKSQFRVLLRGCLPIALSFILSYHFPSLHCNLSLSLERKQKKIQSFISRLTISMDINRRDSPEHRKMVMPSHSLTQGRFFLQSHSIPCSGVQIFLFSASYRMPNRKKLSATRSQQKVKWEWMNESMHTIATVRAITEQLCFCFSAWRYHSLFSTDEGRIRRNQDLKKFFVEGFILIQPVSKCIVGASLFFAVQGLAGQYFLKKQVLDLAIEH